MADEPQVSTEQTKKEPSTSELVLDRQKIQKARIVAYLADGLDFKSACVASGIVEKTGYNWKKTDYSFYSQCEAADAKYTEKLIKCVNAEALKDGKVALAVLRIRRPEIWNPINKIQVINPEEELQRINDLIYGKQPSTEHKQEGSDPAARGSDEADPESDF